ncbi:MAG: hypothetical protein ACE5K3_07145 [bacterium]
MNRGNNICILCGKKARRRCLVKDAPICSFCCGTNRNENMACPAECQINPLGSNYQAYLNLEEKFIKKVQGEVFRHYSEEVIESIKERFCEYSSSTRDLDSLKVQWGDFINYMIFVYRNEQEKNLIDLLEDEGLKDFNNDEKTLFKYYKSAYPTIIEAQRIVDEKTVLCRDILKDLEFTIFDYALAHNMKRYSLFQSWIFHMPHFSKPMMGGLVIPRDVKDGYLGLLTKRLKIFRRKYPKATLNTLFAHEMMVSRGLLEEIMEQRRDSILENLDFKECGARFRIVGSRERIREIIEKLPDFEFEEKAKDTKAEIFTWRRLGRSKKFEEMHLTAIRSDNDPEGIVGNLGRLTLGDDYLDIHTFSRAKYNFCLKMIEEYFGNLVEFLRKGIIDHNIIMKEKMKQEEEIEEQEFREDEEDIPTEIEQELMEQFYKHHYTTFLDEEIPALDGLTPREAAKRDDYHERLIELMKGHINSVETLAEDKGIKISIDWVLKELGLEELLLDKIDRWPK